MTRHVVVDGSNLATEGRSLPSLKQLNEAVLAFMEEHPDDVITVVVESSVVGVRKPEPEFYEIACRLLEVEPADCVFLDDLGVNLKPAAAMGMTTIKVIDPTLALQALERAVGFPVT